VEIFGRKKKQNVKEPGKIKCTFCENENDGLTTSNMLKQIINIMHVCITSQIQTDS
jgi:hypothetical protein